MSSATAAKTHAFLKTPPHRSPMTVGYPFSWHAFSCAHSHNFPTAAAAMRVMLAAAARQARPLRLARSSLGAVARYHSYPDPSEKPVVTQSRSEVQKQAQKPEDEFKAMEQKFRMDTPLPGVPPSKPVSQLEVSLSFLLSFCPFASGRRIAACSSPPVTLIEVRTRLADPIVHACLAWRDRCPRRRCPRSTTDSWWAPRRCTECSHPSLSSSAAEGKARSSSSRNAVCSIRHD